ncbi:hypothetical protein T484DRAFT_1898841, partial [Baffinella frigidus]
MPGQGAAASGTGAAVEVQLADGAWHRGRLVERVAGTEAPRWLVQFDDGKTRDDIRIGDPAAPVRFDAGAYGATVEVRVAGWWCRGRLVELVRGIDVWGVAFEDGDWAEDVRLGNPDVRYVFAEGGAGQVGKRGRAEDAGDGGREVSRKRVGTESGGGDRSGGGAKSGGSASSASSRAQKMPAQEEEEEEGSESEEEEDDSEEESPKKAKKGWGGKAGGAKGERPRPHICETCGKAFSKGRMSARRAARRSRRPATWLCTCGR